MGMLGSLNLYVPSLRKQELSDGEKDGYCQGLTIMLGGLIRIVNADKNRDDSP